MNCDDNVEIERVYAYLTNSKTILAIHGHNLSKLLRIDEGFRHFFCYEVDMVRAKYALNALTSTFHLANLEDEFPEIIRIGK